MGHPDFGRALPCACLRRAPAAHQRDRLLRTSNLGPLAQLTFANLREEGRSADPVEREHYRQVCAAAHQYAEAPQGWLVLTGASGSGKTHLAAAIATGQLDRGKAVFFTFVPDLLDHLRSAFGPSSTVSSDELFETVRTTPLLVLDDFGAHWSTPWAQEKLYQLLNYRYQARLPTVITTDQQLEDLEGRLASRVMDRRLSLVFRIAAPDYRAASPGPYLRLVARSDHPGASPPSTAGAS